MAIKLLLIELCSGMDKLHYEIVEQYEKRVSELRDFMCNHEPFKHNVCVRAKYQQQFDRKVISQFCALCREKKGSADFDQISLIRILYTEKLPMDIKEEIIESLCDYPFWPHEGADCSDMKSICFWTENHIFMLLSSAVLFRQKMLTDKNTRRIRGTELEYQLLLCYLKAHVECVTPGLHEVLSCVYLPYTFAALINIIDFAMDFELTSLAVKLADQIAIHIMHVTSGSGICSLTPAARTYPRFLQRTFGHNINNFVYCMTGNHPDSISSTRFDGSIKREEPIGLYVRSRINSASIAPTPINSTDFEDPSHERSALWCSRLGEFICCTDFYAPCGDAFAAFKQQGFRTIECSPSLEVYHEYLTEYEIETSSRKLERMNLRMKSEESASVSMSSFNKGSYTALSSFKWEVLPFYWSAGLFVHPNYIHSTKDYFSRLNMFFGPFGILKWLPHCLISYWSGIYHAWTTGPCYLGINTNIYKHDRLVLSSFHKYNGGTCGYQTLPWVANFDGIGIWTQAGKGSENVQRINVTNSHTPVVAQRNHLLVAAYAK